MFALATFALACGARGALAQGVADTVAAAPAVSAERPSDSLRLALVHTLYGRISPKSVVATQAGLLFAQNMMYQHTITVYDESTFELVKTIRDDVRLSDFGIVAPFGGRRVRGAPVEAAVTPDRRHVYVSNYSMFGPGFDRPGSDRGTPADRADSSYVYRLPLSTLEVDQVIRVGAVPKSLAVTPDGRLLLVSNWDSFTLSVVDVGVGRESRQIRLGPYPRGIAVDRASRFAYVAVMGSRAVARVDLSNFEVSWIRGVGGGPRHVVISPDDRFLYLTLNQTGRVAKVDLGTGKVVAEVATGSQPRSMAMAPDGRSLYVVNNASSTLCKVRTSDMTVLQTLPTGTHPIGITYVEATHQVWVAIYRGAIEIYSDIAP